MKVRITTVLDVDVDAWRIEMMGLEPHEMNSMSVADVRRDVKVWAYSEIELGLQDRGVLSNRGRQ